MKGKEFRRRVKELAAELNMDTAYLNRELGVGFSGGEKRRSRCSSFCCCSPSSPSSPDTLMERIRKRGLDAERRITELYLQQVADRYTRYFYQYDAAPLFIVDAGQLNPVDRDEDFELLLERLRDMRSYREFFGFCSIKDFLWKICKSLNNTSLKVFCRIKEREAAHFTMSGFKNTLL